ncbi:dihydrodipicolinate synthase family protein [Agromyces aerolatus]|uniref:dihydrodipicolinate synthase family protein n=1 Tax=Agromyces sp. LY-1074 TaxID=3074080 RepID=UPI002866ECCC|nr:MULTISPECIES: dihydrodipicolinate synthase family protein [unclassified Agromyces]MDR5701362.1 dihydrodipicolinate synthase family protein [Agromyces sp. LY-1074]MDR5706849.1 dihydrodipicolinate synthase family protein [Agromyces sp. LY-1358]
MNAGAPRGVLMMAVTPFRPDGEIDPARMAGLARDAKEQAFGGLVVAGGAGELPDLAGAEVVGLVRAASSAVGDGTVVTAGVFARRGERAQVDALAGAGAQALLCFADPDPRADADAGLDALLAHNASGPRLAVVVDHDGARFTIPGLRRASQTPPGIAVKFGSPDLRAWEALRTALPEVQHWISGAGDELAPGFAAHGAAGFTSTTANVAPELIARIARHLARDELGRAGALLRERVGLLAALRSSRSGYVPAVTKAAMALALRSAGDVRRASARLDFADADAVAAALIEVRGEDCPTLPPNG